MTLLSIQETVVCRKTLHRLKELSLKSSFLDEELYQFSANYRYISNLPTPENNVGGFLPYLSRMKNARISVAMTRENPIRTVTKNLSIPSDAN